MKKYIIVIPDLPGYISCLFAKNRVLQEFRIAIRALPPERQINIVRSLAQLVTIEHFAAFCTRQNYKFIEVKRELSYEVFSTAYKLNRDRFRAEPVWNRMNDEAKTFVLYSIEAYHRYLDRNKWQNQMYPQKFLNNSYNNDWDKL